eukprot:TRINITY_DN1552_c0_g1_i1.p1 TRINITY_DN1552_c0_g1~~TRINITY_DN1552_c0_g1_i1.p1  ORF type:complete len:498 (+),score=108.16 TRINITY_DN1552_c0_g1_i1:147-1640(+)
MLSFDMMIGRFFMFGLVISATVVAAARAHRVDAVTDLQEGALPTPPHTPPPPPSSLKQSQEASHHRESWLFGKDPDDDLPECKELWDAVMAVKSDIKRCGQKWCAPDADSETYDEVRKLLADGKRLNGPQKRRLGNTIKTIGRRAVDSVGAGDPDRGHRLIGQRDALSKARNMVEDAARADKAAFVETGLQKGAHLASSKLKAHKATEAAALLETRTKRSKKWLFGKDPDDDLPECKELWDAVMAVKSDIKRCGQKWCAPDADSETYDEVRKLLADGKRLNGPQKRRLGNTIKTIGRRAVDSVGAGDPDRGHRLIGQRDALSKARNMVEDAARADKAAFVETGLQKGAHLVSSKLKARKAKEAAALLETRTKRSKKWFFGKGSRQLETAMRATLAYVTRCDESDYCAPEVTSRAFDEERLLLAKGERLSTSQRNKFRNVIKKLERTILSQENAGNIDEAHLSLAQRDTLSRAWDMLVEAEAQDDESEKQAESEGGWR